MSSLRKQGPIPSVFRKATGASRLTSDTAYGSLLSQGRQLAVGLFIRNSSCSKHQKAKSPARWPGFFVDVTRPSSGRYAQLGEFLEDVLELHRHLRGLRDVAEVVRVARLAGAGLK